MAKTKENGRKAKSYHGKKRGMKPRSQRNRKKPRGGVGILTVEGATEDQDSLVKVEILPLQFPGDDTKTEKRIRVVRPYPFTFATFAKERYVGRSMLCFVIPSSLLLICKNYPQKMAGKVGTGNLQRGIW